MAKDEGFYFPCPSSDEGFAQVETTDRDIFAGEPYRVSCCGAPIVLALLNMEMLSSPESIKWVGPTVRPTL